MWFGYWEKYTVRGLRLGGFRNSERVANVRGSSDGSSGTVAGSNGCTETVTFDRARDSQAGFRVPA